MVDRSNVSGLGMVAVAVLSTGVILASYYHLHRRVELNNTVGEKRPQSKTKKKKVRFADDVALPVSTSSEGEEYGRLRCGAGGKLVRQALRKAACSSTRLAC